MKKKKISKWIVKTIAKKTINLSNDIDDNNIEVKSFV